MSIKEVEDAILTIRAVIHEWDEACLKFWREDHTRYGIVDPIIRALGWKISDPKECHPEYPRPYSRGRRVDYALFGTPDVRAIGKNVVPPDIVIESKPLRSTLPKGAVDQLRGYAWAAPRMQRGRAVLTNGNVWWIYDLELPGPFTSRRMEPVDILEDDPRAGARILDRWLGRSRFRSCSR